MLQKLVIPPYSDQRPRRFMDIKRRILLRIERKSFVPIYFKCN